MKLSRVAGLSGAALLLAGALQSAGWAAATESAPRRLLVTVAQDANIDGSRRGVDASGSLRSGESVRYGTPGIERRQPEVRIYDTRTADNRSVVQTVQVLEGRSAYVMVGQSRAVPQRGVARSIVGGQIVEHVVDGVDYRNVDTGFYVLPRVSGDRVTVEISPQREVFVQGRSANTDVQRVQTTVSGRLGEWIEVAGSVIERGSDRETLLGRAGTLRSESRTVLLKVDELR